jgi:predicted RNase H-like nuclease (RuvC/YqgF family)
MGVFDDVIECLDDLEEELWDESREHFLTEAIEEKYYSLRRCIKENEKYIQKLEDRNYELGRKLIEKPIPVDRIQALENQLGHAQAVYDFLIRENEELRAKIVDLTL